MSETTKPRIRWPAGSSKTFTGDSYQNMPAGLGLGAQNLLSGSTYQFNPLSRNRILMDYMFRGSWIVKTIVESVAEDMTRAGTSIDATMDPDDIDALNKYISHLQIWERICSTIKWARLYGGSLAVIMIDGQRPDTPLRVETVSKDQFKGLRVYDRWMVTPDLTDLVGDLGTDHGLPKYYAVYEGVDRNQPSMRIHHSRCIRMDGVELPYWQRMGENTWGLSVIEPLYDRLVAFDSVTTGAAQLAFKAHLRVMKMKNLREILAEGIGSAAVQSYLAMTRLMQGTEGFTAVDAEDDFEVHNTNFGGLSDLMMQFAQQVSGAAQIPMTRLFAQSPAGLNATGESDLRNYYDTINAQQEARLRRPLHMIYDIAHRSLFGKELPDDFEFSFNPLWQMNDEQKADVALNVTNSVLAVHNAGIIGQSIAMKELRQQSKQTGIFSNITDEDIEQAEEMDNTPPPELGMPDIPGMKQGTGGRTTPGESTLFQSPQGKLSAPAPATEGQTKQLRPVRAPRDPSRDHATIDLHGMEIMLDVPQTTHDAAAEQQPHQGVLEHYIPCVVGTVKDSRATWLVTEANPANGEFEGFRAIVGVDDRDNALDLYFHFHPGLQSHISNVRRMSAEDLRAFALEGRSNMR